MACESSLSGSAREGFLTEEPEEPRAVSGLREERDNREVWLGRTTGFFHAALGFCCVFDRGRLFSDVYVDLRSLCGGKI